jgi:predicted O-methyltransferase YrrM
MNTISDQNDVSRLVRTGASESVLMHPGMISAEERAFLYNCVREYHQKGRQIVDAGVFLGASTHAICEALKARGFGERAVLSFEYGIFNANTARAASRLLGQNFQAGEDFRSLLQDSLAGHDGLVTLHFGDICESQPEFDSLASVMFIDIMKDFRISEYVLRHIFPHMDEDTILIHQDYFHPNHPWIQYVMALNRDCFVYVGRPERKKRINSAIFRACIADTERFRTMALNLVGDRDHALGVMEKAITFHDDPLEKYLVCGSRAAVQAWFDRDSMRVANDFFALLAKLEIAHLALDQENEFHNRRIRNAIRRFATRQQSWP